MLPGAGYCGGSFVVTAVYDLDSIGQMINSAHARPEKTSSPSSDLCCDSPEETAMYSVHLSCCSSGKPDRAPSASLPSRAASLAGCHSSGACCAVTAASSAVVRLTAGWSGSW